MVKIDGVLTQFGSAAEMLWKRGVQSTTGRIVKAALPQIAEEGTPSSTDHPPYKFWRSGFGRSSAPDKQTLRQR